MSNYVELPVADIELDISNPRIARGVAYYDPITSEIMALLLGSTSEACASLRESIRENKGIIHPIVVNKRVDGTYVVIEGNTRLQIYNDLYPFLEKIKNQGGIYSYSLICDTTNNTPDIINNGDLVVSISAAPTRTAENIIVEFTANKYTEEVSASESMN